MSLRNTESRYGNVTIVLHWLFAIAIILLLIVGLLIDEIPKPDKFTYINLHKAVGFTVLIAGIFRWYWMISNPQVKALDNFTKADIAISHATKWLLMLLIILMPVSGWFMSMYAGHGIEYFGLFDIPAIVEKNKETGHFFHEMHEFCGWAIIAILGLHILGALKHHFVVKDNTLNRMLGKGE